MNKIEDIKMRKNSQGIYDFSFADGDFTYVEGLDSAIQMSILCERRASESERALPQKRRGWWGNDASDVLNFEIGSKLWLLSEARLLQDTVNKAVNFGKDCVQWLIEDDLFDRVEVTGRIIENRILNIYFKFIKNNIITTKGYDLVRKSFTDNSI